jgi:hypothetical protein
LLVANLLLLRLLLLILSLSQRLWELSGWLAGLLLNLDLQQLLLVPLGVLRCILSVEKMDMKRNKTVLTLSFFGILSRRKSYTMLLVALRHGLIPNDKIHGPLTLLYYFIVIIKIN